MTIEILKYNPYQKGSLQGFLDYFDSETGYEIYGCTVHAKDGKRWLNLPSKEYKDKDTGETKWSHSLRIREKEGHFKNTNLVLKAVDEMEANKSVHQEQEPQAMQAQQAIVDEDDGMPF